MRRGFNPHHTSGPPFPGCEPLEIWLKVDTTVALNRRIKGEVVNISLMSMSAIQVPASVVHNKDEMVGKTNEGAHNARFRLERVG